MTDSTQGALIDGDSTPDSDFNLADFGTTPEELAAELSAQPAGPEGAAGDDSSSNGNSPDSAALVPDDTTASAKPAAKPTAQPAASPTAKPASKPGQRTFEGITNPQHREALSKMSNEAYALIHPVLKRLEAGELVDKSALPAAQPTQSYIDHENGHVLTEEFQTLQQGYQIASTEREHWVDQLAAIEAGKPIVGCRWVKGQFTKTTQQFAPDARAKAFVLDKLNHITGEQRQMQSRADNLASSHKSASQAYNKAIVDYDKSVFGAFDKNAEFQTSVNKYLSQFPPHIRVKPEARVVAKYHTMHDKLLSELANAKAELSKFTKASKASARHGSPDPAEVTTSGQPEESAADIAKQFDALMR